MAEPGERRAVCVYRAKLFECVYKLLRPAWLRGNGEVDTAYFGGGAEAVNTPFGALGESEDGVELVTSKVTKSVSYYEIGS